LGELGCHQAMTMQRLLLNWLYRNMPDFVSMTQEHIVSRFSEMLTALQSWAHFVAPVGSDAFTMVAFFSLACYLLFAVIALHYALKTWAEKVMVASISSATVASLVLHLSMLHSPWYVGEGALWRFVSLSQYLPWGVVSLSCLYLLYRICTRRLQRSH